MLFWDKKKSRESLEATKDRLFCTRFSFNPTASTDFLIYEFTRWISIYSVQILTVNSYFAFPDIETDETFGVTISGAPINITVNGTATNQLEPFKTSMDFVIPVKTKFIKFGCLSGIAVRFFSILYR